MLLSLEIKAVLIHLLATEWTKMMLMCYSPYLRNWQHWKKQESM
jgi:hypothetical protein